MDADGAHQELAPVADPDQPIILTPLPSRLQSDPGEETRLLRQQIAQLQQQLSAQQSRPVQQLPAPEGGPGPSGVPASALRAAVPGAGGASVQPEARAAATVVIVPEN